MRENISNLKFFKESNIEGFKNLFSLQIYFYYEDIQSNLIRKIDEFTSKLDIFFGTNFFNKMKQIAEDLKNNLKPNQAQFILIRDTFSTYITNSLKKRKDNVIQLLKSEDWKQILFGTEIEIENHLKEFLENIKNYLNAYEKEILKLHYEANNSIIKFFDGKENLPKFRKIFDKDLEINFESLPREILNEIRIKENTTEILKKRGIYIILIPF